MPRRPPPEYPFGDPRLVIHDAGWALIIASLMIAASLCLWAFA